MRLPVERAKERASSKENPKIHLLSTVAEVIVSGDTVLNDSRKDLVKDVKMDLARFTWEELGVLILNCFRQMCFKLVLFWCVVCLPSIPDRVSESVFRESDVHIDESSVAPGSMQTSSRDLALARVNRFEVP